MASTAEHAAALIMRLHPAENLSRQPQGKPDAPPTLISQHFGTDQEWAAFKTKRRGLLSPRQSANRLVHTRVPGAAGLQNYTGGRPGSRSPVALVSETDMPENRHGRLTEHWEPILFIPARYPCCLSKRTAALERQTPGRGKGLRLDRLADAGTVEPSKPLHRERTQGQRNVQHQLAGSAHSVSKGYSTTLTNSPPSASPPLPSPLNSLPRNMNADRRLWLANLETPNRSPD